MSQSEPDIPQPPDEGGPYDTVVERVGGSRLAGTWAGLAGRRTRDAALDMIGEAVALVLGLAIAWFGALVWLVERGGADVTAMVPSLEEGVARAFDGVDAEIGSLRLVVAPRDDRLTLIGRDLVVRGPDGDVLEAVPSLRADAGLSALNLGTVALRGLSVEGSTLSVVRREDGEVVAGLGPPGALGTLGPVLSLGSGGQARDLPPIDITRARIHIRDERDGLDWRLEDTSLRVSRMGGTRARLAGRLEAGDAVAPLAVSYLADSSDSRLDVSLSAERPSEFAARSGPLSRLVMLNAPVERLRLSRAVLGGRDATEFDVSLGEGAIAGDAFPVRSLSAEGHYQADDRTLALKSLDISSPRLTASGRAEMAFEMSDSGLESLSADVALARLDAKADALPSGQVVLDAPEVSLLWTPDDRRLRLPRFRVGTAGVVFVGEGAATLGPGFRPEAISTELRMEGALSPDGLMSLWPEGFVGGARRWIERSVLEGEIRNLRLVADLEGTDLAGETADGDRIPMDDDDLRLDFEVEDGRVRYISTMTPLEGARGRGVMLGNRFTFDLEAGRVGELGVREARVAMPRLVPKGGDFTIDVRGEGSTRRMLELIDQEPFRYASIYNLDPAEFSGEGEVEVTITRPLREFFDPSRVRYEIAGDFRDVAIPFRLAGQPLTDADIRLEADSGGLALSGPVSFGPWRPQLTYFDTLGDAGAVPTTARLVGEMSRDALDAFGVGGRRFFEGSVPVVIDATSEGLNLLGADISADLTSAALSLAPYWSKPEGSPARATASLRRLADGANAVDDLRIEAGDLRVEGDAVFESDARLRRLDLGVVEIDDVMDLSLRVAPNAERTRLVVTAGGPFLDLGPVVAERLSFGRRQAPSGLPIAVSATLDRLRLAQGYELSGVGASYDSDGVTVLSAKLEGTVDGQPASASLTPIAGTEGAREFALSLPDAAGAAQALFGFGDIEGGALALSAEIPPPDSGRSVLGEVEVDDLTLTRAPILAQMLSLASLQGLGDTLSGQGLRFSEVESEFAFRDGRLSLRRTRASGPALGLTVEGEVALGERVLDLNGVLVPAYRTNSLLGDIPLIGDILVGEEGEGIVGLNYFVQGPFSAAQVGVNPLSALTPGVFREIFKPQREDLPDTMADEASDAEEASATSGEAPDAP